MADYRLSRAAERDLAGITSFGDEHFGRAPTDAYIEGLRRQLEQTAATPARFPQVDHIRPGYRRSVYRSHAIYFQVDEVGVLIIRILGRQNLQDSLADRSD